MTSLHENDRSVLIDLAEKAMLQRGLRSEYPADVLAELATIQGPAAGSRDALYDLRDLAWCSIDNDDSRDLDQLTVAEVLPRDRVKIYVAIADVDELVEHGRAVDGHAQHNTTTIYTAAKIFPMLPEKLSTDLTSLNPQEERSAVVVEMVVGPDGSLEDSSIYRALVINHAKLAYADVAAWLTGQEAMPEAVLANNGLADNLRAQEGAARRMRLLRRSLGALDLETIEGRAVFDGDTVVDLRIDERNRAKDIIEDLMIAANGVTARYLAGRGFPSIRRVVRTPRRWGRIVDIAEGYGFDLSRSPDSRALQRFLEKVAATHPVRFPDISLAIVKLLGSGEYVATGPGEKAPGHFGLALKDYTHSTAPNRRYTDLVTQRLLKAALAGEAPPYDEAELDALAAHCTKQEDIVTKVERQIGKSAAALLLDSRVGEEFDAIVTGAAPKGTWVRLLALPVEGRLTEGFEGLDVGDRTEVRLISLDVERGFIDFEAVPKQGRGMVLV